MGLLVTGFVVLALVKPWGTPVSPPSATAVPLVSVATAPPSTVGPSSTERPSPPSPGADAFTIPAPPDASAAWTSIRWRRLASDDPLTLVTSALRWSGGFIATGSDPSSADAPTPVWTSKDGSRWDPLQVNTSSTFWPGLQVLGVAEVSTGLVAATERVVHDCGDAPCDATYVPPVTAWTSPDGLAWTPAGFLDLGEPSTTGSAQFLLATGPAGLVAATTDPATRVATSVDGIQWKVLPADTVPKEFALNDLVGTASGYVAGGRWATSTTQMVAATLWSPDGRTWRLTSLPTASASTVVLADTGTTISTVDSLLAARHGLLAVGRVLATPWVDLLWQSTDGRTWRQVDAYPPLGPTTCTGEGCGLYANGVVTGDGSQMVAVRGGADGGVWASPDGLAWQGLRVTGDPPGADASQAALLPGGVLLSDGTTTWYGEAVGT